MLSADSLYARNIEFAGGLSYDLKRVHGVSVASTLETISDNLMIDAEALSVCLRVCAAFHEDEAKVLMANVPQRAKSIGDFTLLVTSMGSGKSLIFSKLMEIQQLKKQYDIKIEQTRDDSVGANVKSSTTYRHAILNEITGPGLTKYLDTTGNIFVLIDEFDGDHQKLGMFGSDAKSNNTNSSAASVLKSFHTGMPYYQKGKVSDNGHLQNPQVSFLAASNGAPIMDILRAKLKSSVMPDAMAMRTIFEVIDSPPKFNSNYKNKLLPRNAIGLELILLASSLLCNQTYVFDTEGDQSADNLLQTWQDNCVAAGARWKNSDKWISARFAKTSELTARLAAQITHIDLTYSLLQEFLVESNLQDSNGSVSFHTYCKMLDFFYTKYPPHATNPIIISSSQVEAAMYTTEIILLKFFNLFDLSMNRLGPIKEIPWIPASSNSYSNPAIVQLPSTQTSASETAIDLSTINKYQIILLYPSICFTFSQLIHRYPKLKYRYKEVEPMLVKLTEMKLLIKVDNGLRSGRNLCNLYIKILPSSITLNTVNSFVVNSLDQIKMPWALFKASCEKVILPAATATLTAEVQQILNQDHYRKIIEKYETAASKTKKKKSSAQPSQNRLTLIDSNISNISTDNDTPSINVHLSQNIMPEKENESPVSSRLSSESNTYASSSVTQSSQHLLSVSPSSQIAINSRLPRPSPPILHHSNIDNNTDPTINAPTSNSQNDDNNLSVNNKENELIDYYLPPTNEDIHTDVRRSIRARTKKKRIYSPEPSQRVTNSAIKRKKPNRSNDKK